MRIEIGRRADQQQADGAEPAREERRIARDLAMRSAKSKPSATRSTSAVAEREIERHLRIGLKKGRQDRAEIGCAERQGRADPHEAARHLRLIGRLVLDRFAFAEDARGAIKRGTPRLGQG